jgi:hypothetical protein
LRIGHFVARAKKSPLKTAKNALNPKSDRVGDEIIVILQDLNSGQTRIAA